MYTLQDFIGFMDKLYEKKIRFQLNKIRDSVLIEVSVPNQMWEIEFMQDGAIEIEKFISTGEKFGEKEAYNSIIEWSDDILELNLTDKIDLFGLLSILEKAKIFYTLEKDKENDSISVVAIVPGQKWRIDCFSDGKTEIEKFLSSGDIYDEKELDVFIKKFIF